MTFKDHKEILIAVRKRIENRNETYVCHALRSVIAEAVMAVENDVSNLPDARYTVLMGMELYAAVQDAINDVPHLQPGDRVNTFTYARFLAAGRYEPDDKSTVDDRADRLDWLDRSINTIDDVPGVVPRIKWF